jgi:hypothetical protein
MSTESSSARFAIDRPARAATSPSFFFVAHLALLAAVLFDFSPTFYLHSVFKVGSFPTMLYVHGAVLTGWFVLTVSQASLIHLGRPQLHRQLGYVTAGYALLVVVMGLVADTRIALQTARLLGVCLWATAIQSRLAANLKGTPQPPIPQYPSGFFARYCW